MGTLVLWVPFAGDSIWSVHPLALIIAVNLICVDVTRYFIKGLILPSQI
ncbi:hypothetical protein JCM19233_681 [Vibrio astriarenae]|nr:hypothetical protein JCM19233_681 [Vibrio sp. C7]